jgi:hypothetical protein
MRVIEPDLRSIADTDPSEIIERHRDEANAVLDPAEGVEPRVQDSERGRREAEDTLNLTHRGRRRSGQTADGTDRQAWGDAEDRIGAHGKIEARKTTAQKMAPLGRMADSFDGGHREPKNAVDVEIGSFVKEELFGQSEDASHVRIDRECVHFGLFREQ